MPIYSWNMEHGWDRWPFLANFFDADAICLQETSTNQVALLKPVVVNGLPAYTGTFQIGSASRGKSMTILLAPFGTTLQNSVAVMVDGAALGSAAIRPPPPLPNLRWTPGLQQQNGVWVFSIHAPSGKVTPLQRAQWTQAVLAQIAAQCPAWICAGDYNADPAVVAQQCAPQGALVVSSGQPTHLNGEEYDFAVCSPNVVSEAKVLVNRNSDHWPTMYWG